MRVATQLAIGLPGAVSHKLDRPPAGLPRSSTPFALSNKRAQQIRPVPELRRPSTPRSMAGSGEVAAVGGGGGSAGGSATSAPRRVQLRAVDISPESFQPFGQVVQPTDDGKAYDEQDAQLVLNNGIPRFYIMRLPHRGRCFSRITYHARVTQCLGSLSPGAGGHWFLGVARPSLSLDKPPRQEDITVFRIPHGIVVKLEQGTWHAGPLFDGESMDFVNLENATTNIDDHNTHVFEGVEFEVVD